MSHGSGAAVDRGAAGGAGGARGARAAASAGGELGLACAALLCGARTDEAIAAWGRNYDSALLRALGFTHPKTPCAATLFWLFRRLERAKLEAVLGAWAEQVLAATPAADGEQEGIAVDGETLRGSRKQGAPGAHLLSAVSQRLGLTLGQGAVGDKTNEIPVAPTVLRGLLLEGRVVTMDALLTQREVAQAILDAGGDDVLVVTDNQPQLRPDSATLFSSPPSPASGGCAPRRARSRGTGGSSGGAWRPARRCEGTWTGPGRSRGSGSTAV